MLGYNSSVNIKNSIIELCYEKTAKLVEDTTADTDADAALHKTSIPCSSPVVRGAILGAD